MARTSHSPSGWRERIPLALLAIAGLGVSVYLTAYQVGALAEPWDPIFGPASSGTVLHSALARALPVPDASLGAAAYLLEIVTVLAGGTDRWRTHPWIVLVYGAVVAGLALVSVGLVAMQILAVRSWCLLCLCSAAISFTVAILAAAGGEVHAAWRVVMPARAGSHVGSR